MKKYRVTAERDAPWWLLRVPQLGIATQLRRLDRARDMAQDLIAGYLDVPLGEVDVSLELGLGDLAPEIKEAVESQREAERAQLSASQKLRRLVATLVGLGLTVRDVGVLLDLSHQRVAQLLADVQAEGHGVVGRRATGQLVGPRTSRVFAAKEAGRASRPAQPPARSALTRRPSTRQRDRSVPSAFANELGVAK